MQKNSLFLHTVSVLFLPVAIFCLVWYFSYAASVVPFPYDWEPTDGDHLNFAHRLAQGLPIYLPMDSGRVLSVYTPLYHGLVALVGGADSGLSLARGVSFMFWWLCPAVIIMYYSRRWGYRLSVIAAIFLMFPIGSNLPLEMLHVTPNSTMAFLFLCSLLLAQNCVERKSTSLWAWLTVGATASLCFFAKQVGIIAVISIIAFLLVKRADRRSIALVALGFSIIFAPLAAWLEWANSGHFLQTVLLDLRKIIPTDAVLARQRLTSFIFENNFAFLVCVVISFVATTLRVTKLSIWHVSFILHVFLLLQILGNAGGGDNYFASFWITIVLLCLTTIAHLQQDAPTGNFQSIVKEKLTGRVAKLSRSVSPIIALMMLTYLSLEVSIGALSLQKKISNSLWPSKHLENLMEDYYLSVHELLAARPHARVLTNRNVGALVDGNASIENEGATMFIYAWPHKEIFGSDILLSSIREKKYDFITTGASPYPTDVQEAIQASYEVSLSHEINLGLGRIGQAVVYTPRENSSLRSLRTNAVENLSYGIN